MNVAWPFECKWTASTPMLARQRRGGAFSVSGVETVVPSLHASWEIEGSFIIYGERASLQWAAFVAQMEGGIGTTVVPVFQKYPPRDLEGRPIGVLNDSARLSGAQTWEHFGFGATPYPWAVLAEDAPLRASHIVVEYSRTSGLRPGHVFSIGDRLYRAQNHWTREDGKSVVRFQPPLRAAATSGEVVRIDQPACRCRFVSEDNGVAPDTVNPERRPQVKFREAL